MKRFQTYISLNEALESANFYYTFKEKCYDLNRKCEVNELVCNQIEADTNIFRANYISEKQDMLPIAIHAKETDVMCLSLHASTEINLPLYLYKNGKYTCFYCIEILFCNYISSLGPYCSSSW